MKHRSRPYLLFGLAHAVVTFSVIFIYGVVVFGAHGPFGLAPRILYRLYWILRLPLLHLVNMNIPIPQFGSFNLGFGLVLFPTNIPFAVLLIIVNSILATLVLFAILHLKARLTRCRKTQTIKAAPHEY